VQYAIDKVNTVVQEYLDGTRPVKASAAIDELEKFDRANTDLSNKSVFSQLLPIFFTPSLTAVSGNCCDPFMGVYTFKRET